MSIPTWQSRSTVPLAVLSWADFPPRIGGPGIDAKRSSKDGFRPHSMLKVFILVPPQSEEPISISPLKTVAFPAESTTLIAPASQVIPELADEALGGGGARWAQHATTRASGKRDIARALTMGDRIHSRSVEGGPCASLR
jgi:hypothetical protein